MIPSQTEWTDALIARHGIELHSRFSAATVAVCGVAGMRDSNPRSLGPKRIRGFFLTFLAPFGGFIQNTRWYSELSSPLIPPVFSVVVVKTVVRLRLHRGAYGYSVVGVVIVPWKTEKCKLQLVKNRMP